MSKDGTENFGTLIKSLLKKRSITMRKLSDLTGIDTATISRIANNRQQPRPYHLQQFAHHLGVPMAVLLQASGFDVEINENNPVDSDMYESIDTIHGVLISSNFLGDTFKIDQVHQELAKYEQYALTEEGEQRIREEFETKVEQVRGAGPFINELKKMHQIYLNEQTSQEIRSIIGSAILYFILSTDIIPDYVFPFGYLDDAIAVQIVAERVSKLKEKYMENGDNN
ncbi:helix-turn-helix domain-containing protein [Bacillus sp. FJAT-49732]|uniref:Helix-turn-helix domain-containing protein n=1 Tax=Lederbergia citrisecunda TaxID=2833583 RepID=A0A942YK87_9BACI|nr:DUF1232 domain-containing protein [Lederbergia citrisecunda]MBS4198350.1 helix-turn-helix domain-containing protein [Lederbergia citrisecunda]